jgi:hypothetical protein
MNCHECARVNIERPAVGLCRFCFVGLCKAHLVAAFHSDVIPQYGCHHDPDRGFAPARQADRFSAQPAHPRR